MTGKRKVIPKLEIHKRGKLVDSFLLNTPRLVIGSAPGAHIRLRSAEIETEHLVIELVNRRFLEAVNVAGDPHLRHQGESFERVRLGRGSVITLGPLAFKLVFVPREVRGEPRAEAPRPEAPASEAPQVPMPPAAAAVEPDLPVSPGGVAEEPEDLEGTTDAITEDESEAAAPTPAEPLPPIPADPPPPAPAEPPPPIPTEPPPPAPVTRAQPPAAGEAVEPPPVDADGAVFVLVQPPAGERRKRVRLPVGTFDIGREGCDINLYYEGIAAQHASLMVMPDGHVYVRDKGSGLPTVLNGKVAELAPLRPGDRLQIGTVTFEIDPANTFGAMAGEPGSTPESAGSPEPTGPAAGAGAWVQAAMDTPPRPETSDAPSTGSQPVMPVRRIGRTDREKARNVGTGTDPHQTARDWVRQAIDDSVKTDPQEVEPEERAPTFATAAKKARGPRSRRQLDTRSGPEKVAAARFPEWATTTIPPEYRARKRRRQILSILVVLVVVGVPTALIAWQRGRAVDEGTPSDIGGETDPDDPDVRSVLANTDGAYPGLRVDGDSKERSSSRKKSRRSRRSRDRDKSRSDADDGEALAEDDAERLGPTYGPGGRSSGVDRTGAGWGVDLTSDPDLIAIGNPGPGSPVIAFGSPHLGGTMVEEDSGGSVRRVEELQFELADDANPTGRGSVDMDQVEKVLRSITPSVRACYTRALESDPDLSGTMVLILTLSTSGQITSSSLDPTASSLVDTDLKRCVERQVKSQNYPVPDGGQVTFSYPFRFNQP